MHWERKGFSKFINIIEPRGKFEKVLYLAKASVTMRVPFTIEYFVVTEPTYKLKIVGNDHGNCMDIQVFEGRTKQFINKGTKQLQSTVMILPIP